MMSDSPLPTSGSSYFNVDCGEWWVHNGAKRAEERTKRTHSLFIEDWTVLEEKMDALDPSHKK